MDADGIDLLGVILSFMVSIREGDECPALLAFGHQKELKFDPLKKVSKASVRICQND